MKILIFGGSFNPIHKGHLSLLKKTTETFFFNQVWIIPNSLDKEKIFLTDKERIDLIKNDLQEIPKIKILESELNNQKPVAKKETIKKLEKKGKNLYFLMCS